MKPADLIKAKLAELAGYGKRDYECECGRSARCACCKRWISMAPIDKYKLCSDCAFFIGRLTTAGEQ